MLFSFPPRVSSASSYVIDCSSLLKLDLNGYKQNSQNHPNNHPNNSKTYCSKFSGSGPAFYSGKCRSTNVKIHGSSYGIWAPICEKSCSNLLGWKHVNGL